VTISNTFYPLYSSNSFYLKYYYFIYEQLGNLHHNSGALSPALLALSMYNYVPSLSPKPGDVLSEEDISGFGSHSRFSYSLSSINGSHNNSHNSLQSLSSANGAAVCISDKYNETEIMLDPKDKAVSSHVVECVGDLRVRTHLTYLLLYALIVIS
jgi:hypothetical protein